jgi:hypothetical protein
MHRRIGANKPMANEELPRRRIGRRDLESNGHGSRWPQLSAISQRLQQRLRQAPAAERGHDVQLVDETDLPAELVGPEGNEQGVADDLTIDFSNDRSAACWFTSKDPQSLYYLAAQDRCRTGVFLIESEAHPHDGIVIRRLGESPGDVGSLNHRGSFRARTVAGEGEHRRRSVSRDDAMTCIYKVTCEQTATTAHLEDQSTGITDRLE